MDWTPLRDAVQDACVVATGLAESDVLLETEQEGFAGASQGKRLRLSWEERDLSTPATYYQEQPDGSLIEYVQTDSEIIINARFYTDDHRTAANNGGWAFELAHRLKTRLWLSSVAAIYQAVGLVLASTDVILPDPQVTIDNREMSVATLRIAFNYSACEFETDEPGDPNARADWFDRAEINGTRPRAVYQRDLLDLGPWRFLWLGEQTDIAGGRIVQVSGDSQLRIGDPRHWQVETGALALEDLDQGQLLDGQALALVLRAPAPTATISIAGRLAGGVGWALEGLASGALRLSALGTGGETSGQLTGRLDSTWRVVVVHNAAGVLGLYEGGSSATATITGSHWIDGAALTAGALREPTAGVDIQLLGQVVTDDPDGFRAALESELGI
jgi:hypothetical protein